MVQPVSPKVSNYAVFAATLAYACIPTALNHTLHKIRHANKVCMSFMLSARKLEYPQCHVNKLHFSAGVIDYEPMEMMVTLSGQNHFEELIIPIMDDTEYDGPDNEEFFVQVRLAPNGQNSERVRISADLAEVSVNIIDNDRRPGIMWYNNILYTF